jgi:hypothetical protein
VRRRKRLSAVVRAGRGDARNANVSHENMDALTQIAKAELELDKAKASALFKRAADLGHLQCQWIYSCELLWVWVRTSTSKWECGAPMTGHEPVDTLLEIGCHQTDIADAFHDADPDWIEHLDRRPE